MKYVLLLVDLDLFPTLIACAVNVFINSTSYCLPLIKRIPTPFIRIPIVQKEHILWEVLDVVGMQQFS